METATPIPSNWLRDFPFFFVVLSGLVMPVAAGFIALWRRSFRGKVLLCVMLGYLAVANIAGVLVYNFVPWEYALGSAEGWSWPPTSDPLGMRHGKYTAIAAGNERTRQEGALAIMRMVRDEQAAFFGRWLGLTLAGLAPVILLALIARLFRRQASMA